MQVDNFVRQVQQLQDTRTRMVEAHSVYADKMKEYLPDIKDTLTKLDSISFDQLEKEMEAESKFIANARKETIRDKLKIGKVLAEVEAMSNALELREA